MPPNDGYYTISNTTEYLPWGWQKSLDHTNDPSGTILWKYVGSKCRLFGRILQKTCRVSNLCSNQIYRFSAWISKYT